MKRLFDKVYFSAELLSSETILSGEQNLIKFLISDTIGMTEIDTIEFRLRNVDRDNTTKQVIIEWTPFVETSYEDIYSIEITPVFTISTIATDKTIADIKITDIDGNVFYLVNTSFKPKVL